MLTARYPVAAIARAEDVCGFGELVADDIASRHGMAIELRWPHLGHTTAFNAATYCVSLSSISPGQEACEPAGDRVRN